MSDGICLKMEFNLKAQESNTYDQNWESSKVSLLSNLGN